MEAQQFWDDIPSRQSGYRLLATCQVPFTLWSSTKSLGGSRKKKAASLTVYFFQSKLSWSWPCRHRAPAVAPSCPSRSLTRPPALQPQSACIICLHHATPRHADAQGLAPCEKRWRNKVAKERAKAGLGNIWNLALRSCRWTPQCFRRQSTAARHLRTKTLELERSRPQIAIA